MRTKAPQHAGEPGLPADPHGSLLSREASAGLLIGRRGFMRSGAALAGATLAVGGYAASAWAEPLPVPESNQMMGDPIPETGYGMPTEFEAHVVRLRSNVFVNKQNQSDWSMTPLHQQVGIVTPNGLFFERTISARGTGINRPVDWSTCLARSSPITLTSLIPPLQWWFGDPPWQIEAVAGVYSINASLDGIDDVTAWIEKETCARNVLDGSATS